MPKYLLRIVCYVALAIPFLALADVSPTTKPVQPRSVNYNELGRAVDIIGPLQEPLGKVLVIEGKLVPKSRHNDYWSANLAENLFEVEKIDGKTLTKPLEVQVHLPPGHARLTDAWGTFTGYQNGSFVNEPDEVVNMKYTFPPQITGWHFDVKFIAFNPLPESQRRMPASVQSK